VIGGRTGGGRVAKLEELETQIAVVDKLFEGDNLQESPGQ